MNKPRLLDIADTLVNLPIACVYTISRCRADSTLHGPIHWSADAEITFCGKEILGNRWWILSNDFRGGATYKKCIQASSVVSRPRGAKSE